jgi:hypothetical protein
MEKSELSRVPRFAQRRAILFFWPIDDSSENQISIVWLSATFSRAIASSRRVGAHVHRTLAPTVPFRRDHDSPIAHSASVSL